jgi:hypothetical protein
VLEDDFVRINVVYSLTHNEMILFQPPLILNHLLNVLVEVRKLLQNLVENRNCVLHATHLGLGYKLVFYHLVEEYVVMTEHLSRFEKPS